MESFILAIAASSTSSAQRMLDLCRSNAGLKRACITSVRDNKIMMALMDTQRIETLIAKDGRLLVTVDYLSLVLKAANEKLQKTRVRMRRLEEMVKTSLLKSSSSTATDSATTINGNRNRIWLPKKEFKQQQQQLKKGKQHGDQKEEHASTERNVKNEGNC
jgi:tRNA(Phe) wybutosine-synthesizing methylase Tyw3